MTQLVLRRAAGADKKGSGTRVNRIFPRLTCCLYHPQYANLLVKRKARNGETGEKKVMTQERIGHDLKGAVSIQKAFLYSTDSDAV